MAFLKWFLDVKNGPPFLSFGGFQKPGAIFFVVFGSLLERGTSEKNKDAIFVFVFDVPFGTTLVCEKSHNFHIINPRVEEKVQLSAPELDFFFNWTRLCTSIHMYVRFHRVRIQILMKKC